VGKTCNGHIYKGEPFDVKTFRLQGTPIDHQNCWTFTVPYGKVNEYHIIKSIQPGYPNPGKGADLKGAQESERALGEKSLCLKEVAPLACSKGGRQARRTKRRSHRNRSRRR